jgi:hypothetical protein
MDFYNQNLAREVTRTWDNIHIDHIRPISMFDLDDEDELSACCHFTNLQPLLPQDNLQKSNKWSGATDHENNWNQNKISINTQNY